VKRILLSILIIGIFLLSACGAPTYTLSTSVSPSGTGSVSPPSGQYEEGSQATLTATPASGYTFDYWSGDASGSSATITITMDSNKSITAHFEEPPDYTPWIASELRSLNQAMIQFATTYPILTRVDDEEEGEILVHKFTFGTGGNWGMVSWVSAVNISEAKTHIENAYYLTNKSKLPSEVGPRDVSADEITQEVSEAISLLELQLSYSYSWEESNIEWAGESTNPEINRESTFRDILEHYDEYREEVSKVITKLELILSRLPSATNVEL